MAELSISADTVFRLIEILHELVGQNRELKRDDADEGADALGEGLAGEPDDARPGEVVRARAQWRTQRCRSPRYF